MSLLGFVKIILNIAFAIDAGVTLYHRSTEIAIIILSTALMELSVYGRYILVSLKLPFYSRFLEDFDIYLKEEIHLNNKVQKLKLEKRNSVDMEFDQIEEIKAL